MNAARAGRSMASLAGRRVGRAMPATGRVSSPGEALYRQGQVANKGTSTKGKAKGIAGSPPKPGAAPASKPRPPPQQQQQQPSPAAEMARSSRNRNNMVVSAMLVGAVGSMYFYTMGKMKDQDFLGDVEREAEEEAQVNLHKSGLKISTRIVPETYFNREAGSKAETEVESAKSEVTDAVEDAKEKVSEIKEALTEKKGEVVDEISELKEELADEISELKEELADAREAVTEAVEAALPSGDGEVAKKKKKGWRKYIIFGPRSGGD